MTLPPMAEEQGCQLGSRATLSMWELSCPGGTNTWTSRRLKPQATRAGTLTETLKHSNCTGP